MYDLTSRQRLNKNNKINKKTQLLPGAGTANKSVLIALICYESLVAVQKSNMLSHENEPCDRSERQLLQCDLPESRGARAKQRSDGRLHQTTTCSEAEIAEESAPRIFWVNVTSTQPMCAPSSSCKSI